MNIEQVREYCLNLQGCTEDQPYGPDMIVFRVESKIFLHLPLEYAEPRIAIKLPPEMGQQLREQSEHIRAAYHLNKVHWNDVFIEHSFSDEQIEEWINTSYRLVISQLPKKIREKYVTFRAK